MAGRGITPVDPCRVFLGINYESERKSLKKEEK
jgi:hypothetical protein